jgi:hypothetical protein
MSSIPPYYEKIYLYIKIIPEKSSKNFIYCVTCIGDMFYVWRMGGIKPLGKTQDPTIITGNVTTFVKKYKKYEKFEIGYFSRRDFVAPKDCEDLMQKSYDLEPEDPINLDELQQKLSELFDGLIKLSV